ncbi:MAG TPA: cupredoxin domain-containing protein [Dehalococcoidia bacterium]|nr:cupredoxin domain-containing protein [Dehalococcoidia bacterium]
MRPGPQLKYGLPMLIIVFAVAAVALYGGATLVDVKHEAAAADGGGATGGPANITITAKNIAFDKRTITVSAGVDVTVTFVNADAGVLHNVAFYTNRSASSTIAKGATFAGPGQEELKFVAPGPGSYFYRCDVHPDQMTGTFAVK